ncbi:glutathione ABC transporter substrate-binding protein [Salinicoccus sp. ID82-1]|uniref:glutathione ABC transporter substrate-binding protein n=1 Tax=Salinicoccus sp. ID82-1 TaxID=2820269 RepID=UPI001F3D9892|nr:glutathione ABC transporter substrate-binding protein [Salinicoccus sp. ID82-1]MCG1010240.1 glutathione ABC transporter substrate-binding protein [Salinicoccus sp. ID82-1]
MKKTAVTIMMLCILILAGCTDDSNVEPDAGNESQSGGDFILSTSSDLVSLDPHGSNDLPSDKVRNTIYEGLVTQNEDLEIEPLLATEWQQEDDVTWTFTLREDVTFHDGSPFNAEVVKANLDRVLDPGVASPRMNLFEMIESVEVVDEYEVEIVTSYPFAPLLHHLTHDGGGMISKEVIDEDYSNALEEAGVDMTVSELYSLRQSDAEGYEEVSSDISEYLHSVVEQNPAGTGYLQLEERNPGESTVLSRFDDYWGTPANLDTVTFKVVTETSSQVAELETGASHMISGFDASNIERIENNPETHMYTFHSISMEYVGFNTSKAPLDDRRVRQAITHVFDKEEVLEGIYNGTGRALDGPLQPEVLGYDESIEGLEYDVDRAKALMAEAGYEDGFEISIITNDTPERVDVAVYLQEALQQLNIEASVEQIEWGAYLERASTGEHDIFILGWPNTTGDPDQGLWPLYHSSMIGSQGNRFFFENDELDALLEAGRQETDTEERRRIYQEAQQLLIEEAPSIFMRQAESTNAYRDEVEGLSIDRYNKPDFRNVTLEN